MQAGIIIQVPNIHIKGMVAFKIKYSKTCRVTLRHNSHLTLSLHLTH